MNISETFFQTWQQREAFALGFREASVEEWSNARELEFEQRYAELLDSADGDAAAEAAIAWAYDRGAEAGHAQMAAQEIAEADPRMKGIGQMGKRAVRADSVEIGQWVIVGDRPAYCVEAISTNSLGDIILRCSFSGPGAYPGVSLLLDPGETVTIETEAREGIADPWSEGIEGFDLPDAR